MKEYILKLVIDGTPVEVKVTRSQLLKLRKTTSWSTFWLKARAGHHGREPLADDPVSEWRPQKRVDA